MAVRYHKIHMQDVLPKISTLLLDFDGTLVDYLTNEQNALRLTLEKSGVMELETALSVYTRINQQQWERYERKEASVEEITVNRFRILADRFGINTHPEELNRQYLHNFSEHALAYPGVVQQLQLFREHHPDIQIIILTNGRDKIQQTRATRTGILPLVDGLVSSEEAGVAKPSPKIFQFLASKMSVDLSSCLMVGDSLTSDIQGAVNVGIPNCLITEDEISDDRIDISSSSLVELLEHLHSVF